MFMFIGFGVYVCHEIHESKRTKPIANCVQGVICTAGGQVDCYEPEQAYMPEFGLVCPR